MDLRKNHNIFHSALIPLRAKKYAINFEMSNEAALKRDQNEQLVREVGELRDGGQRGGGEGKRWFWQPNAIYSPAIKQQQQQEKV